MNYEQINIKDRENIYELKNKGIPIGVIAQKLYRHKSTIHRELLRNKDKKLGYLPDRADSFAKNRKNKIGKKIEISSELRGLIMEKLKLGFSPEMISGRCKIDNSIPFQVSHETIYQYIYSLEGKKLGLFKLLVRSKSKRGRLYSRKSRGSLIPERTSIHSRPKEINMKTDYGHFEGDLTFCKGDRSSNIAVLTERKSKFSIMIKNESKKSYVVIRNIFNRLAEFPKNTCKSLTFDNGGEFSKHLLLKKFMNIKTFFCDPGSPWQKGLVEHTNAMIHRFINKKTSSLNSFSDKDINMVQNKLNNLPRKSLGFKTPAEVFYEQVVALRN